MDEGTLSELGLTWDDWDRLPTSDQDVIETTLGGGMGPAGGDTFDFGSGLGAMGIGDLPPGMGGGGMGMGGGMPELSPQSQDLTTMLGQAYIPEYKKGVLQPLDQSQAAQVNNLMQDQMSLYVDNVLSMLSGPGSYTQGAFTPTRKMGKPLPGRSQINALANRPTGGYRALLAAKIREGAAPEEAANEIWGMLEKYDPDDKSITEDDHARMKTIIATLPGAKKGNITPPSEFTAAGMTGGDSGASTPYAKAAAPYDAGAVMKTAENLWTQWNSEQGGWEDPESGQWYDAAPTETPTQVMKWYDKYGLPYPTAKYEDQPYIDAAVRAETGMEPGQIEQAQSAYDTQWQQMGNQEKSMRDRAEEASKQANAFAKKMAEYTKAHDKWEAEQQKAVQYAKGFGQEQQPGVNALRGGAAPQQQMNTSLGGGRNVYAGGGGSPIYTFDQAGEDRLDVPEGSRFIPKITDQGTGGYYWGDEFMQLGEDPEREAALRRVGGQRAAPPQEGPAPGPGMPVASAGLDIMGNRFPVNPGQQAGGRQPEAPWIYEGQQGMQTGNYEDLQKQRGTERAYDFAQAVKSMFETGRDTTIPTRKLRRGTENDRYKMGEAVKANARKQLDLGEQKYQLTKKDPSLAGLGAWVLAREMGKQGRNPLRDALEQRALGAYAMRGY